MKLFALFIGIIAIGVLMSGDAVSFLKLAIIGLGAYVVGGYKRLFESSDETIPAIMLKYGDVVEFVHKFYGNIKATVVDIKILDDADAKEYSLDWNGTLLLFEETDEYLITAKVNGNSPELIQVSSEYDWL